MKNQPLRIFVRENLPGPRLKNLPPQKDCVNSQRDPVVAPAGTELRVWLRSVLDGRRSQPGGQFSLRELLKDGVENDSGQSVLAPDAAHTMREQLG